MEYSKWFDTYFKKLVSFGVPEESVNLLKEKYGESLMSASIATKADSGCAYEGSLIETVVTKVTKYAVLINDQLDERVRVNKNVLCKICFLSLIGMADRVAPQTDEWRKKNLGECYTYKEGNAAIPTTLHSVAMCSGCGISFTPEEMEAMTIIDRKEDDKQAKYYSSMLSQIVKSAYELTFTECRELHKEIGGVFNS